MVNWLATGLLAAIFGVVGAVAITTTLGSVSQVSNPNCGQPPGWTDINIGDWTRYYGCLAGTGSNNLASNTGALLAAVQSWVQAYVYSIFNNLFGAFGNFASAVQSAFLSFWNAVVGAVVGTVTGVSNWVSATSAFAGPFAPLITALLAVFLVVTGFLLLYFGSAAIWAVGKTIFNLF